MTPTERQRLEKLRAYCENHPMGGRSLKRVARELDDLLRAASSEEEPQTENTPCESALSSR